MKIKQVIGMNCALCGMLMDFEQQRDDLHRRRLFGTRAFAQCPVCFRSQDPDDPEWKQEVIEWHRENRQCWKCGGKLAWYCDKWSRVGGRWEERKDAGGFICVNEECEFSLNS